MRRINKASLVETRYAVNQKSITGLLHRSVGKTLYILDKAESIRSLPYVEWSRGDLQAPITDGYDSVTADVLEKLLVVAYEQYAHRNNARYGIGGWAPNFSRATDAVYRIDILGEDEGVLVYNKYEVLGVQYGKLQYSEMTCTAQVTELIGYLCQRRVEVYCDDRDD